MTQTRDIDVAIIGGGIVGVAAAFKLIEAGRSVTVIDRKGIGEETSRGNAGGLAFSEVLPLASSGMLRKLPKWLSDPLGPLAIPPAYLPQITPWLLRFWRAGWPDKVKASIAAQGQLMRLAQAEMASLVRAAGIEHMIHPNGVLELYESMAELKASEAGWAARTREGIAFAHLRSPSELAIMQPGLSPRFVAGTFIPSWQQVSDPYDFTLAIAEAARQRGAQLVVGEVTRIGLATDGVSLQLANGQPLRARQVVIAGGAWSKTLAAQLGDNVPLETERGYNTTLPPGSFDLKRQLTFGGHGFVISPLTSGIRIGGAVELGGLELPPNFARADAMLQKAKAFLPDLRTEGGRQWMGFRPSMPDSLPVIGASRRSPDIIYAFGHGHLGLTQSAATGKLVAELLTGRPPSIDLSLLSPQRF